MAVFGLLDYYQMKSELKLFFTLAEAEEDLKVGSVAPIQETFDDIRKKLLEKRNEI